MPPRHPFRPRVVAGLVAAGIGTVATAQPADPPPRPPAAAARPDVPVAAPADSPIDLGTALRLAGAENPELLLARQRVTEAAALRQLAAVQVLPNLNVGGNFNLHRGPFQQSNGNILSVHRDALYLGLGAGAVGSGTLTVPGLNYNLNVGEAWYGWLAARQRVTTAGAVADAVRNDVLLRVCLAHLDLIRGDARVAVAVRNRAEAAEVARLTDEYAKAGQGRKADADRAAVEVRRRDAEQAQAEGDALAAAARLAQLLNLDPAVRLRSAEGWVVPAPVVPDAMPLPELLAVALLQRPELAARRSEVQQTLYELSLAKVLPFSPTVILGFSAGGFGGGSNLVSSPQGFVGGDGQRITGPRFSDLSGRTDFDAAVLWTVRNLGVGNVAITRAADSRANQARLRELDAMNRVRAEVAEAHARVAARAKQIDAAEKAVRSSGDAYGADLTRIKGGQGLPLEVMDSLRLLARSRFDYLDAVVDYNRAQFQLWVAMGNPPADVLSRPIPREVIDVPPGPRVLPIPRPIPLPGRP